MRPTVFSSDVLRQFLRRNRIATLPQLKQLLGTEADITVFRKLKELSYRTSYSHRRSFYTLDEIAGFDDRGLWSFNSVWFSSRGTLVATAEDFVTQSKAGYFASELEELLHVPVKEPLLQLVAQGQNEVADFQKWGIDIIPHRLCMKQGFEVDEKSVRVDTAFKDPKHPFRIA